MKSFIKTAKCPFCKNSNYTILSQGRCPGCERNVSKMFCSVCGRDQLFSIDDERRGCWKCGHISSIAVYKENRPERNQLISEVSGNKKTQERDEQREVIREKEVITREVVYVQCKYCGKLMLQTELVCPNCGARRNV
ncbi:MAG: hypothetical protein ABSD42_09170 [Candidatus Bathyarchaeia archaeon]